MTCASFIAHACAMTAGRAHGWRAVNKTALGILTRFYEVTVQGLTVIFNALLRDNYHLFET